MTRHSMATLAALVLAGTVLLAACGQDATPPASADATTTTVTTTATTTAATTAATTATHLPATDPLSTEEVQEIFAPLVERALTLSGRVFNSCNYFEYDESQTVPAQEAPGNSPYYALVVDDNIHTLADLKALVEQTLTPECAQRTYYRRYLDDGSPLYWEYKGRLYVDTNNGGHGFPFHYREDTVDVRQQWADAMEVAIDTFEYNFSEHVYSGTAVFTMLLTDDGWRLDCSFDEAYFNYGEDTGVT